jgi:hypothetical protein
MLLLLLHLGADDSRPVFGLALDVSWWVAQDRTSQDLTIQLYLPKTPNHKAKVLNTYQHVLFGFAAL